MPRFRESAVAAAGHVLSQLDGAAPHTGKPWSDAMLFGLSGGTGHGYILWEFSKTNTAPLVLHFVHRWNYPEERLAKLFARTGVRFQTIKTTSAKKAQAALDEAIVADIASPLVCADWLHCPYGWLVQVRARQGDHYLVADSSKALTHADIDLLAAARSASPAAKNRMHRICGYTPVTEQALQSHVCDAINDAVSYQTSNSASFALPALKKWQRMLVDQSNKKSWPSVFGDGRNLARALMAVYQRPLLTGSDGAGMRALYADFLDEAAPLLPGDGRAAAGQAVSAYRQAGRAWQALAHAALPLDVPELARLSQLLTMRAQRHDEGGVSCVPDIVSLTEQIDDLCDQLDHDFPLNAADKLALFETIAAQLDGVIAAEQDAIYALDDIGIKGDER